MPHRAPNGVSISGPSSPSITASDAVIPSILSSYPPSHTPVNQQGSSLNSSIMFFRPSVKVGACDKVNLVHHPGSFRSNLGTSETGVPGSTERLGNVSRRSECTRPLPTAMSDCEE